MPNKFANKTSAYTQRKKWCPVAVCFHVCVRLNKHLQKVHKIKKGSVTYKIHLKEARPYCGLTEIEFTTNKQVQDHQDDTTLEDSHNEEDDAVNESAYHNSASSEEDTESHTGDESDMHKWLCAFFDYLALPDAGHKKLEGRIQHASQVQLLLEQLDPKSDDLDCLTNDNGDAVWKRWVQPSLESADKAPGTIISYLTSPEKFLQFLTSCKYEKKMPPIHVSRKELFHELIPSLKGWRTCVDAFTQDCQLRRYITECIPSSQLKSLTLSRCVNHI